MSTQASALNSVRRKLFLGVLLTSLVALVLSAGSLFFYDLHSYRKTSASDLRIQAELLAATSAAAIEFDDRHSAAENIAFLKARPAIRAATIYGARGDIFATYERSGLPDAFRHTRPAADGVIFDGDTLAVVSPITVGNDRVGTVFIEEDLQMASRIASYAGILFIVSAVALMVALLLSQRLQSKITAPIIHVADLARRVVATRDYTLRATEKSNDEIGTLADAVNEMLSEIQARTAALEASRDEVARLNEDLERRVARRTSQLQESNLQLQAADAAKSRFLSMMSHEIRTPMNGVLGMLELLALTRLDDEQKSTLTVIGESGRSLLRIIDDILDFSKIEAGKLEVVPQPASIQRIVSAVAAIYSGNASSKALTLRAYTDPAIGPALLVDATRLQQILNNLVSNAIKFTAKGFVDVRADLERTEGDVQVVKFSVTDTGIGVAPEAQARLFEPFAQADTEVSRVFGGTGLGLSIGQRLARLMGGSISMHSVPGQGTTMTLELPLRIADDAPAEEPRGRRPKGVDAEMLHARGVRTVAQAEEENSLVLIVDDHPVNRMVLVRQVGLLGYACESANDGKEALAKWASGRFRLVFTDCNMPEMDGYQLAQAIRERESGRALPRTLIIACTANALRGEAEKCLGAGMDDYIAKPVDMHTLMAKLDHWLPHPDSARPASPRSAPPPEPQGALDYAVLREVCGDDPAIQSLALEHFLASSETDYREMRAAISARDLAAVARGAHRLKGAAATVGAANLAFICHAIERAAGMAEAAALAPLGATLGEELERVRQSIESFTTAS